MKEFEYPMWFKSLKNDQVIEFDSIDTGMVVKKGFLDECSNIGYYDLWIPHTDVMTWVDVTYQYKEKTEIAPLKMCGMPKCKHGIPYYSECEECQKEAQEKQNNYLGIYKRSHNKYKRKVPSLNIDVYDILKVFNVVNPATQHAIKKLLCAGDRGYKDKVQDLKEALASIERAIELEGDNVEA